MAREISRQAFLRGAVGALAAGAVLGAPRVAADPRPSGWEGLSTALGGKVLLPDSPQFAGAKQVFNTNYNGSTPAAVVTPTSAADVQKAMAFAAAHNLKVAPRSGGHSYTGASTANGTMVLDLRQLPGDANYDAATGQVTVTPATSLYTMHRTLAAVGRGVPTGTCPSVGAAGHALGGGMGAQSRHAGLLCDQLTSASVVLPSGQAVTASAASNPDLFWALRGGGGGNFGVTTSLTFATFPTKDVDAVNLNFPPQSFAQVLVGWQNWLRTADPNSWALADATVDAMGVHCRILATCPAGSGNSAAAAITQAVGIQPSGVENHTFNYMDLVNYLAVGNLNPQPLGYVGGSDVFPTVNAAVAQGIAAAVNAFPRNAGRMLAIMHALDGALATVAPAATAFPWRRQSALVQWYVETSGDPAAATNWLASAHQAVQQYSVGGYVNYLEANQSPARYFGPNLSRLSAVRQKYDPGRVMFSGLNY
ncbi:MULTISPECIES: FAD-dependent oxidoreductase [Mycobacterium avium complex (MAC)]|uniref:FAD-binding oxidoreductase n=5 Tax=Mycobacterium avium complex (MAC) TaxID=120793 RepID=A0A2A3LDH2_MYCAV|nr:MULTISPECIES: FAD-binding oxidoreductase [Mycobacterium avium complex (MAC)]ETB38084.1 oxidoreductase [Mycobacterium avium subsp. hominissuis 10-5606]AXO25368.1 FAD-binding oxidoreductase [Mycobacterium avium subsp. hominissuis]ETZ44022.1 FAD binding domain protein [Mycobacterium avium MAV_061107_1842]KDP03150.1 oxidoreductase [Mycobacterium avium subsp. hominissuis 3388]MBZ4536765.1 FAD-binding oxidoreductase [Mycobacterium avium subsp. hominissuis]